MKKEDLFFRQLFDSKSFTYTYLIADPSTGEAALIDTVKEQLDRDLNLIRELSLKLQYVLDTHVHADHITGAGDLRKATGAETIQWTKSGVECADILIKDQEEVSLGRFKIKALATPGHTDGCLSYLVAGRVFTGDALFIRGCGRTDFQHGSPEQLYDSITQKLFTLPPETLVYPGHDYHGMTVSTISEEKLHNPRIGGGKTKEEFVQIMKSLHLDLPKQIQVALPANLSCGTISPESFQTKNGV